MQDYFPAGLCVDVDRDEILITGLVDKLSVSLNSGD